MKWFFKHQYNFFDVVSLSIGGIFIAVDMLLIGFLVMIIGIVISVFGESLV